MSSILIKGGTIVRVDGMEKADVLIENNAILKIGDRTKCEMRNTKCETIDAAGMLLMPGFIDCHVHFREPGGEQKETLASGARAARAGGVTTVCDMPNTDPPTTTAEALKEKIERGKTIGDCDVRFFFGVTEKGHTEELKKAKAKCCGVKVYFDHSTGDQKAEQGVIEEAFKVCADLDTPLVGHCEDPAINEAAKAHNTNENVAAHSDIRPPESEEKAIATAIELTRKHGTRFHVAHVSTAQGIDLVREAKTDGLPVTCEVTPHHLLLTTDHYEHFGTLVKMNPPLRTQEHVDALWKGIADHTIDCIATDHAPHTLEEKQQGPPFKAPNGVPGVETMVPLLLTIANARLERFQISGFRFQVSDIVRLCFENPNRIFNLGKSDIIEGASPDIVLVDSQEQWEIRGAQLTTKCGWTPFEGFKATGRVKVVLRASEDYRISDNAAGGIV